MPPDLPSEIPLLLPARPRVKVLLVGGDRWGRDLVEKLLSDAEGGGGFALGSWAPDLERARALLDTEQSEIALLALDKSIDDYVALRTAAPELPIVLLCAPEQEELALRAVRLGAQEYLIQSRLDAFLLHRTLRYAVERARVEAALAHEREMLSTLLENIPDRIYFKDEASRFTRVNRAMTEFFRIARPDEAYGRTDADFFGPEHATEALEDERRVMKTGEPLSGKVEKEVRNDGAESWSLTTKIPLRDRSGRVIGTCGISREITQIKQMEERLDTERKLLRSVIDNVPDCIFLKDEEGRFILANAAFLRLVGATSEAEVIGKTIRDFYPAAAAERVARDDAVVVESRQPSYNCEEHIIGADSAERWLSLTRMPWFDDDGKVVRIVCLSRDVTDGKNAEHKLKRAYAEADQSRKEVLRAMEKLKAAHQQLREVQLQLIEAEKMKTVGRLAAGVAHEVKNPLAVIKMGVECLNVMNIPDEAAASVVKEMSEAVHRADHVIRGLLDFSAPTRLDLRPENLNQIIEDASRHVRNELPGPYQIVQEFESDLPEVRVDASKLTQSFINIIANGVHAMEHKGVVTVRTYARQLTGIGQNVSNSSSGSYRVGETVVVAEIDDTGPGIPEDKIGKVFEPFFTTKPTGKGTGLGLSVVKTIIDLHGGSIDLRNLPDSGVRATITLPV